MSKGLEALEDLKWQVGNIRYYIRDDLGMPRETTLMVRESGLFECIEKELKALEIIKEKVPFVVGYTLGLTIEEIKLLDEVLQ